MEMVKINMQIITSVYQFHFFGEELTNFSHTKINVHTVCALKIK